jgi:hypothetical protein
MEAAREEAKRWRELYVDAAWGAVDGSLEHGGRSG